MSGKILFSVDFSPFSEKMLGCAAELAQAGLDEVIVLHVMESKMETDDGDIPAPTLAAKKEKAEEKLAEFASVAREQGLNVRALLKSGNPATAVVDTAREEEVDLIFIGSHGRGFFHRHIMGSVSDKIIKTADRPVLVLKCDIKEKKDGYDCENACSLLLGHVLVANDFSEYANRVKPVLDRFASTFCTRITLLYVHEGPDVYGSRSATKTLTADAERNMDQLAQWGNDLGPYLQEVSTMSVVGEPVPKILQVAKEVGATLIVVGAGPARGARRLYRGGDREDPAPQRNPGDGPQGAIFQPAEVTVSEHLSGTTDLPRWMVKCWWGGRSHARCSLKNARTIRLTDLRET